MESERRRSIRSTPLII